MTGHVKLNFGKLERVAMKECIHPIFTRFLKKCYSKLYIYWPNMPLSNVS